MDALDKELLEIGYSDLQDTMDYNDRTLKVGMKMKSKLHGYIFVLDDKSIRDLKNDHMGEWWHLFEIVPDNTPISETECGIMKDNGITPSDFSVIANIIK